MRILHLSDLHSFDRHAALHKTVLGAALDSIGQSHAQAPIDLVVVSGDIAMAGTDSDYQLAQQELLDPVLQMLGLSLDAVVIVPGNHDVDTHRIDDIDEAGFEHHLSSLDRLTVFVEDDARVDRALLRQTPFFEFRERYLHRPYKTPQEKLANARVLRVGGSDIGIVEVNSAWRATGAPNDGDRGKLLSASPLLRARLEEVRGADVRLVVLHHPPSWSPDFELAALENALESDGTIVLTGHEHFADPRLHLTVSGTAAYIRSGCLFGGTAYRNEFSIIDIDVPERRLTITPFAWIADAQRFVQDHDKSPAGEIVYELPHRDGSADRYRPRRSQVAGELARLASDIMLSDASVLKTATDLIAAPRLYNLPYAETVALAGLRTGDLDDFMDTEPLDPLAEMLSTDPILLVAEPGTGLTASLLYLLQVTYEANYRLPPVYVPFRRLQGPDPLTRQIVDRFQAHGIDHPKNQPLPALLVGVDDLRQVDETTASRIVSHIAKNPACKYVLACDPASADLFSEAFKQTGAIVGKMHLGPFGRSEIRQLASKIGGPDSDLNIDTILDTAFACDLPRNGFVMSVLINVLASDPGFKPPNESSLLALFIDNLLGKLEPDFRLTRAGLDGRDFEVILGTIAAKFIDSEIASMARADLELLVNEFYVSRGNRLVSGGHVVDFMIRQRLMDDRDGEVGFSHDAILQLSAARHVYENAEFRSSMLRQPMRYRKVLLHAAALRRHDTEILRQARVEARPILDRQTHRVLLDDLNRSTPASDAELVERIEAETQLIRSMTREEHELHLDNRIEQLERQRATPADAPILTEELVDLVETLDFLSGTLASSELVDDASLKCEMLGEILATGARAYDSMGIESVRANELKSLISNTMEEAGREVPDEVIEKMSRVALTLAGGFFLAARLDSPGLGSAVQSLLDSDEFMSSPTQSLYATLLNCRLGLDDWAQRLVHVHKVHGRSNIIGEVTRSVIVGLSFSPSVRESDAAILQKCIADEAADGVADGPHAVAQRNVVRNNVRQRLQTERTRRRDSWRQMGIWELLGDGRGGFGRS